MKEAFEEWVELQSENWMHETYYYRDLKACWQAATERAAGIPKRFKYPEGHRQDDYVIAVNRVCSGPI